ncbi:FMN-binding negative transcriptional regulator [Alteromonas sp. ASW11-36]|uniref:FMN-binding negative transcriptional regulator n=1 Tax=Alteromonas arenosi TaxID=3055817 RepID=A0ABT7T3E4_9ALTE|nr:FMN-binding negative transcriptional regulator [Alteromonas sp. ASW11-36]MDM7862322.1 FMN-binding negative transcriptional regulator [Alteromonas sp. ASW11-36]
MFTPKAMAMQEPEAIRQFIADYGFGLLITADLNTTRLPLLFQDDGDKGMIIGHMAKANPQWQVADNQRVSAVFSGPHAYISPTWYESRPVVATWNYASVQCFGTFSSLNRDATRDAINALMAHYEPSLLGNTELLPVDYMERLLNAVVGFKIVINEIHAKEKLGQQKSKADQCGVYQGLLNSQSPDAANLVRYMDNRGIGNGKT